MIKVGPHLSAGPRRSDTVSKVVQWLGLPSHYKETQDRVGLDKGSSSEAKASRAG